MADRRASAAPVTGRGADGLLGRFLEISIHAPDVPASLEFYRSLGLTDAVTGDIWDHAYAVVTDGQVALGLHAYEFPSPALTWVCPGIPGAAAAIEAAGIELEFLKTGDERFNELGFVDPDGQIVTLLEARTFSPPSGRVHPPAAGFFRECRLPVRVTRETVDFWEQLGFVVTAHDKNMAALTADGIALTGYTSRRRDPVTLVFEVLDLTLAATALASRRLSPARVQDPLDGGPALELVAPEGTPILIVGPVD